MVTGNDGNSWNNGKTVDGWADLWKRPTLIYYHLIFHWEFNWAQVTPGLVSCGT
ncbi:MAG: hypothetical protein CM15mP32_3470 [Flavobacteriaceae bacterium]|nr:MAG: hypothetical protein CM15mP32_3470 [Flavobacteriaceae bacterium]